MGELKEYNAYAIPKGNRQQDKETKKDIMTIKELTGTRLTQSMDCHAKRAKTAR